MVYKECTSYSGKTLEFLKCVMVSFMFESTNIISGISVASSMGSSGWWFQIFFIFTPDPWGNDPNWRAYFSDGWEKKPPTSYQYLQPKKVTPATTHPLVEHLILNQTTWICFCRWLFPDGELWHVSPFFCPQIWEKICSTFFQANQTSSNFIKIRNWMMSS